MSTALLVIDIQNDYFPNGKMELSQPEQAANNAAKVIESFRNKQPDHIFHVQHIATDPAQGFFLPNTEGVNIHESVQPLENETVITKHFPNSFLQTDLASKLEEKEIKHLVVVGMMTHMCIDATVRAAVDAGYQVTLLEDACATRSLSYNGNDVTAEQVHYSFVGALNGMYCEVTSTEDFLK